MTPKEIKEEQEASKNSPIASAPTIQPDKADIKTTEAKTELGKSQPIDTTEPKESDRQYEKKVGDYKNVVLMMKEKGIDPDNPIEATETNKTNLIDAVKGAYSKDVANKLDSISKAYSPPPSVAVPKIDQKALMDLEKRKRRVKWADALYAFGEGLQGRTANPENFASTRIQRSQDKQFQDYKDATERNQNAKYLYDNKTRSEWIDWADKMQANEALDQNTKNKLKELADQYRQGMEFKSKAATETARHNKAMENIHVGSGRSASAKQPKTIKIQTSKKVHELSPEEADLYRSEVIKNPEKYPSVFNKIQKNDQMGMPIEGEYEYKKRGEIKDLDYTRAYLESKEQNPEIENTQSRQDFTQNLGKTSIFDKYVKKESTQTNPVKKVKSDTLGLGI